MRPSCRYSLESLLLWNHRLPVGVTSPADKITIGLDRARVRVSARNRLIVNLCRVSYLPMLVSPPASHFPIPFHSTRVPSTCTDPLENAISGRIDPSVGIIPPANYLPLYCAPGLVLIIFRDPQCASMLKSARYEGILSRRGARLALPVVPPAVERSVEGYTTGESVPRRYLSELDVLGRCALAECVTAPAHQSPVVDADCTRLDTKAKCQASNVRYMGIRGDVLMCMICTS